MEPEDFAVLLRGRGIGGLGVGQKLGRAAGLPEAAGKDAAGIGIAEPICGIFEHHNRVAVHVQCIKRSDEPDNELRIGVGWIGDSARNFRLGGTHIAEARGFADNFVKLISELLLAGAASASEHNLL